MWTRFMDMASGGGCKTGYEYIYIEADSEYDAIERFELEFGRDPNNITCECCGEDFSISSDSSTLEEATEYERSGESLEEFLLNDYIKVVHK